LILPPEVLRAAAAACALLLLSAALGKMDSWRAWSVTTSQLFSSSPRFGRAVRFLIPLAELVVGIAVIIRPKVGLFFASLLVAAFSLGVGSLVRNHRGSMCNCFGPLSRSTISYGLSMKNGALSLAIGIVLFLGRAAEVKPLTLGDILLTALVGLLAIMTVEFTRVSRARGEPRREGGSVNEY
jgi:uncharacterized membrane protein HdeD (DUF308 family)